MPITPSNHVPISVFLHGKQELQLTGQRPLGKGFTWNAEPEDAEVVSATVQAVESPHFPVHYWELVLRGRRLGKTRVHVQEAQATDPVSIWCSFVIEVTVLGMQA